MGLPLHAQLGLVMLVVNLGVGLWAAVAWRRGQKVTSALMLAAGAALALQAAALLAGVFTWLGTPATTTAALRPALVHVGGPLVALILSLGVVAGDGRRTPGRVALVLLLAALAALASALVNDFRGSA